MLKFVWKARHTRAPADPQWQAATDELHRLDDAAPLQGFPRAGLDINAASPPLAPASPALSALVHDWAGGLAGQAAVVMVHGFDFDPTVDQRGNPGDDPYTLVFGPPDQPESWLPMIQPDGQGARCVAFAWTSIGDFFQYGDAGWSNPYQYPVLDLAPLAARALATVIAALTDAGATVDLLAHSLGTRTSTQALRILAANGRAGAVRRAVLLGGAQFCCDAEAAMAQASCQVFNLVNRDDEVLGLGGEPMCHPYRRNGSSESKVIGLQGLPGHGPRWLDLQLDSSALRDGMAARGYPVSGQPVGGRGRHWAYYRQPGNRKLIADLLSGPMLAPEWFAGLPTTVTPSLYVPPCPVPATPLAAADRIALNEPNPVDNPALV